MSCKLIITSCMHPSSFAAFTLNLGILVFPVVHCIGLVLADCFYFCAE